MPLALKMRGPIQSTILPRQLLPVQFSPTATCRAEQKIHLTASSPHPDPANNATAAASEGSAKDELRGRQDHFHHKQSQRSPCIDGDSPLVSLKNRKIHPFQRYIHDTSQVPRLTSSELGNFTYMTRVNLKITIFQNYEE